MLHACLQAKDVRIELYVLSPVGQCSRQHVSHSLKFPQDDEGTHRNAYPQGICITKSGHAVINTCDSHIIRLVDDWL